MPTQLINAGAFTLPTGLHLEVSRDPASATTKLRVELRIPEARAEVNEFDLMQDDDPQERVNGVVRGLRDRLTVQALDALGLRWWIEDRERAARLEALTELRRAIIHAGDQADPTVLDALSLLEARIETAEDAQ